jgi:hypothetical protein
LGLEKWSHGRGEAGAVLGGGARRAVVARMGGGGLVAFVRRRKKARVARWAAWAERAMKSGGPGWWDGGLAAWAGRKPRPSGGVGCGRAG